MTDTTSVTNFLREVFLKLAWSGPLAMGILLVFFGFRDLKSVRGASSGNPGGSIYYASKAAYYMIIVGLLCIVIWATASSIVRVIAARN